MGKLFKSSPKKEVSNSHALLDIPDWLSNHAQTAFNSAINLGTKAFNPYGGDAIADFSQDELDAFQGIRDRMTGPDGGNPLMAAAEEMALGMRDFNPEPYMNPFYQNVVDVEKREALSDFDRQFSEIKGGAAMRGAFGGSRQGVLESSALDSISRKLGDIQAIGSRDAYDSGVDAFFRHGQSAGLLADVGNQVADREIADLGLLEAIGAKQREQDQAGKDFDYAEFLRGEELPFRQQDVLNQTIFPNIPTFSTQLNSGVTKQSGGEGSPFGQIVGGALSIASLASGNPFGAIAGAQGLAKTTSKGTGQSSFIEKFADGGAIEKSSARKATTFSDLTDNQLRQLTLPHLPPREQKLAAEELSSRGKSPFAWPGTGTYEIPETVEELDREIAEDPLNTGSQSPFEAWASSAKNTSDNLGLTTVFDFWNDARKRVNAEMRPPKDERAAEEEQEVAAAKTQNRIEPEGQPVGDYVVPEKMNPFLNSIGMGPDKKDRSPKFNPRPISEEPSIWDKITDSEINSPLMRMGMAMLSSKGNFGEQLGAGGTAFMDERERLASEEFVKQRTEVEDQRYAEEQELKRQKLMAEVALAQNKLGLKTSDIIDLATSILDNAGVSGKQVTPEQAIQLAIESLGSINGTSEKKTEDTKKSEGAINSAMLSEEEMN